ncbi:hypothetical protein [Pseudomonas sp.]|uniref:hypothetical protein n=1 Tax=Pseudomonas sp. TaxID=306 RepID=UPI003D0C9F4A
MFDTTHALRTTPTGSLPHLERDLDAGLRDSLDYQILRRTLMPEAPSPEPAPAPEPAATPASEPLEVARQAEAFLSVVEQRELNLTVTVPAQPQKTDPLVLDLAGNGFSTSGLQRSIAFDLNGDGRREQISVPTGDDALLALDRNGNGRIDDGRELFGDQHGARNGFAELSKFDGNRDGRIDAQDAVFERLSLLRFDAAGRQHSQNLAQAGVSAIRLDARDVQIALGAYDEIAQLGQFEFGDGRTGTAADLLLASR